MKAKIITNIRLDQKGIREIKTLTGIELTVQKQVVAIKVKRNPYFNQMWIDFDWLRSLFPEKDLDIRAFFTNRKNLLNAGTDKGHIGMYDLVDRDKILDFYFGLGDKLDNRARANGFETNLAWGFIHEMLHGLEQKRGITDRVHAMERQGRLKELMIEHLVTLPAMEKQAWGLMQWIIDFLKEKVLRLEKEVEETKEVQPEPEIVPEPISASLELLERAVSVLGTDASPNDDAPDELGCAETVSNIIGLMIDFPVVTGTWTLWSKLIGDERFEKVGEPEPGAIVISPTGMGNGTIPGHTAIVAEDGVFMSNDSYTGKFKRNYTQKAWRDRYMVRGGFPVYYFKLK